MVSNLTEKKREFFVVENFEFNRVDYCCTICIKKNNPPNYTVAINSLDCKNWISTMRREFDSLENNTFEWQKAPRNKNIVVRCFLLL